MERREALRLVRQQVATKNLVKHMVAAEAVMRRLARALGEDEEAWGLTGLLHDVDYDQTKDRPDRHSLVGGEMLEKFGLPAEVVAAVKAHNERHGLPRDSRLAQALYAVDPLTGLIVAAALIHPDKKLASIDAGFVLHRFEEKHFARGANREQIKTCAELGLSLADFVALGVEAMQGVASELGL